MRYLEIKKSLTNKFVTNDQFCKKFEKKISSITNSKFALVCNNGDISVNDVNFGNKNQKYCSHYSKHKFCSCKIVISLLKEKLIFYDVNKTTAWWTITHF